MHKHALITFINIIRQKCSIEKEIALRQEVMKGVKDESWFLFVKGTLHMYN